MKTAMKKALSALLAVVIIATAIPFTAFAEDADEVTAETKTEFSTQSGLNQIVQNLSEAEDSQDYSITNLEMNGKKGIAVINNAQACKLVAAIYEEGSSKMLASEVVDVEATAGEIVFEFDILSMPETYTVKVFLLDENNAALCDEYVYLEKTEAFKEFLAKEPEDFIGEDVIIFDDEKAQTDFAVLDDDVKTSSSKSITYSYNESTGKHTFRNADNTLKNLSAGDIYSYKYGDDAHEVVVIKVKEITVSGSTVTIIEDTEIGLGEAFSFVRIDAVGDYAAIDESEVEYGDALTPIGAKKRDISYDEEEGTQWSTSVSLKYTRGVASVTGTVGYSVSTKVKLHYDPELFGPGYYDFYSEVVQKFTLIGIEAKGELAVPKDKVRIATPPLPVGPFMLTIYAAPVLSVSASISLSATVQNKTVVTADSNNGVGKSSDCNSNFKPEFEDKITVEIGVAVGFDYGWGKIVKLNAEGTVKRKWEGTVDFVGVILDKHHDCYTCIKGNATVSIGVEISLEVKIIPETLEFSWPFLQCNANTNLGKFYCSESTQYGIIYGEGECPNISYETKIKVYDEEAKNIEGATVSCSTGYCDSNGDGKFEEHSIKTDSEGEAIFYCRSGSHNFTIKKDKYKDAEKSVVIISSSKKVPVKLTKEKFYNVTLKVTDEEGKLLSGAKFYSETAYYDVDGDGVNENTSAFTGSDGKATLQFKEGTHTVSASCKGYETKTQQTIVTEDKTFTIKLKKQENYDLTVTVKDNEGEVLPGATVTATGDSDADGENEIHTAVSDSSGVAVLTLQKATWEVTASKIGYKSYEFTVINLSADREASATLTKNELENGDLIEFGSYPQSKVTDTALLSALNSLSLSWASYGYYSGTGDWNDGQMQPRDYMKYADVTYKGERYRAVKFTEYRPHYTGYQSSSRHSTYQDDNGYYANTVYWFKFEPLEWRVLDPEEGLIMCESIIDSQAYNNTCYDNGSGYYQNTSCTTYANDYAESSIRVWLNDDFYNTAFTSSEKAGIKTTTCDNSSSASVDSLYDSITTYDKIFLLSIWDAGNTNYAFSSSYLVYDTARRAQGTDYAKCQGLSVSTVSGYEGNSDWWLRTPGVDITDGEGNGDDASLVYYCGYLAYKGGFVFCSGRGVRPALKLNLQSLICESYGEQSGTVSIEGEGKAEFTTQSVSTKTMSVYNKNCIAGNRYVLLNVSNYSEDFELNSADLLYIDMLRADANGIVSATFTPKSYDENGTILLIGDFGSGTEAKVITEGESESEPEIKGKVHSVSIDDISMKYKDGATLTPSINVDSGVNYTVTYSSSNTDVVSVDSNGNITTNDKGSATITVTVTDEYGNTVTDTCNVNVSYKWWQWIIVIVLFGWIWY